MGPPFRAIPVFDSVTSLASSTLPSAIRSAVHSELGRSSSTYYAEFEALYHIYPGLEQLTDRWRKNYASFTVRDGLYAAKYWAGFDARRRGEKLYSAPESRMLDDWGEELIAEEAGPMYRRDGPVGLCLLRREHLEAHPDLDGATRLTGLPSLEDRFWTRVRAAFNRHVYEALTGSRVSLPPYAELLAH
ncbi:hypothetical protein JCM10450v2_003772 [Rhodotorula kratochvilovae]